MKALFVLPYDNTYRYRAAFVPALSYQPLTLSTLAALVPEELGWELTLVDEGVQRVDYSPKQYDLVCISTVTSSAYRGYELARFFQKNGSYTVLGGHHATLLPEEAAIHADTVITGAAEGTFPQFCIDFAAGKPKKRYHSGAFQPQHVPVPRRDLMPQKGYLKQPAVLADYGCPNNCKYCVIHSFWGHCARRPVGQVLDEIRNLGTKEILLLDPSPFGNRDYACELLEGFAFLGIQWAGLCTLDTAADPLLLSLLQKSGCVGMLMGFESFSQEDLDSMQKHKNKVASYGQRVDNLHQHGMAVLGTFMLGMDGDTAQSLHELPELIAGIKIDVPRFAVATPWPNTPFFQELEQQGRILHRDWSLYDSVHCVFQPKHMSPDELEQAFLQVWRRCYSPGKIAARLRHTPQRRWTALVTNIGFHIYARRVEGLVFGS